jgi:hypothetical protein
LELKLEIRVINSVNSQSVAQVHACISIAPIKELWKMPSLQSYHEWVACMESVVHQWINGDCVWGLIKLHHVK